jgi:hypothetical protein
MDSRFEILKIGRVNNMCQEFDLLNEIQLSGLHENVANMMILLMYTIKHFEIANTTELQVFQNKNVRFTSKVHLQRFIL